ncbi:MAG: N-acyl-D-amino-acid deacylase [Actinomycetota bacterium]|nr:N-acyl-D-amino-acid deacylase [Actinomycetota bacterium]
MFDLLIENAGILDGTGTPARHGWIGIVGDRIAAVETTHVPKPEDVQRVIDARGGVLAPGFVDVHNHSDLAPMVEPGFESTLSQGVTSVVVGNCGVSAWPNAGAIECAQMVGGDPGMLALGWSSFGAWLEAITACEPSVNVAALVGHGAVRAQVMGLAPTAPSAAELTAMRALVAAAMEAGAVGLSTGLIYVPGIFAATEEVIALAREAACGGGLYASHIRGEGAHLLRAVDEAIRVGAEAGLPTHISHLKCETEPLWGRAEELLGIIHAAADVTADQYPYTAWESSLSSLLPPWAPVEEIAATAVADRDRLRAAVEHGEKDFQSSVEGVGWHGIFVSGSADPSWDGKSVAAIAEEDGRDPFDVFVHVLDARAETWCIGHAMHEDDVRTILADSDVMVASDAVAMSPTGPLGSQPVHPRNYGTFPRAAGRYVREGVLSLEAAVRKMTQLPAVRFGLKGRGVIAPGAFADIVIFDPARLNDTARFGAPHSFSEGIEVVLVNGRMAWNDGVPGERAGRVLRH